jgi:nucleoside 2-deoxyribosyltransferase
VTKAVVYISGPMTGIPYHNYPAFQAAAAELRAAGYTVLSPAEITDHPSGFTVDNGKPFTVEDRHAAMRKDIEHVLAADAVVALPGWTKSAGAVLELQVATAIGTPVFWTLQHILDAILPEQRVPDGFDVVADYRATDGEVGR